jgi:hypothetical protein
MKNIVILIFIGMIIPNLVYAGGLSDYPEYFVDDDKLDVIIVVGDRSPAVHVIAQTQLALSLTPIVSKKPPGLTKLASEISEIEGTNIISIGSACINEVSARILSYPDPCDQNLEPGKATIELFKNDDNIHIVLNALSEDGIKEAANVLANYGDFDLEGTFFQIDFLSEASDADGSIEGKEISDEGLETVEPLEGEAENPEETGRQETENDAATAESPDEGPQPTYVEEDNLVILFFKWIASIFK